MALGHLIMVLHLQLAIKDHRSFESVLANLTEAGQRDLMPNDSSNSSSSQPASPIMTFVPLAGLILFYVSFAIGGGPVPAVLTCEVFPHNVNQEELRTGRTGGHEI